MDKLNRIINLDSEETITYTDINDIIDYFYAIQESFVFITEQYKNNSNENNYREYMNIIKIASTYIRNVLKSVDNKFINANTFLELAIKKYQPVDNEISDVIDGMILIAIPLRYGASSNQYLLTDSGYVHLMVYTVKVLRGKVSDYIIEKVLYLLKILGSSESSRYLKASPDNITVFEWLDNEGYNTDFDIEDQIVIGTIADKPDIAFPGGKDKFVTQIYDEDGILQGVEEYVPPGPEILQIIMYNAYECAKYASIPKTYSAGEIKEVKLAIDTGALELFKVLIDRGFNFSYFSMNRLLVNMSDTVKVAVDGETVIANKFFNLVYMDMLKYVISKGVKMDREQFNMLNTFSNDYADKIEKIYGSPLWVKACSGSDNIPLPEMVKSLAFSLGIDASDEKPKVCKSLKEVSLQDKDELKNTSYSRQKIRSAMNNLSVSDIMDGQAEIYCKNITGDNDPLKYADGSLAIYTDGAKNTWCFTASDFESLLESPVNPVTRQPLPPHFVRHIANSLNTFKIAGVKPRGIMSYPEAIDKLAEKDKITNANTDFIVGVVNDLAKSLTIDPIRLRMLRPEVMHAIFRDINMDQDYLDSLPRPLQFTTFCKIIYIFAKNSTRDDIKELFARI